VIFFKQQQTGTIQTKQSKKPKTHECKSSHPRKSYMISNRLSIVYPKTRYLCMNYKKQF